MPKAILFKNFFRNHRLLSISDARWARLRDHLPTKLPAKTDARLRSEIAECCSWFLTQQARLKEGRESAAAIRGRPDKRELGQFEKFVHKLREAADAWKKM